MTDVKENEAETRTDLVHEEPAPETTAPESQDTPEQEERPTLDPREAAVRHYREMREKALKKDETDAEPEAEPEPEDEPEPDAKTKPAVPDDEIEITVYGRKEKLTREELIRRAQKASAADIRLNEANATIQQLTQRLNEAQSKAPEQPPQKTQQKETPPEKAAPAPPKLSDEEAAQLARAIQMGDEDESRAAIQAIYQKATEQAAALAQTGRDAAHADDTTQQDLDQKLEQRFRQEREQASLDQDLKEFASQYQDILADPRLTQAAIVETHRLRAEDLIASGQYTEDSVRQVEALARTDASYAQHLANLHRDLELRGLATRRLDLFNQAGASIREWHGGMKAKQSAVPESQAGETDAKAAEKTAKKKALPSQPKPATKRAEAKPEPSHTQRNANYVRSLMKDRGTLVARN